MSRCCQSLCLLLLTAGFALPQEADTLSIPLGGGMQLEMVRIKQGKFRQGSPANEPGRGDDEQAREVTISKDFFLAKYPVTRGQFQRFIQETNYQTEAERGQSGGFGWDGTKLVQKREYTWRNPGFPQTDQHPVTVVTYADAQAFAKWLGTKANRKVALPTEAQWEYACRAGTTMRFHNGDRDDDAAEIAWYKANAGNGTRPVGEKKANAWGLHDMSGNVYEWCRDWYGPYEGADVVDPDEQRADRTNPARRVLRGGSWLKDAKHCRSAARYRNTPGSRNADNGLRVIAAVTPLQAEVPPVERPPDPKGFEPEPYTPVPSRPMPATSSGAGKFAGCFCLIFLAALLAIAAVVGKMLLRSSSVGRDGVRPPPLPAGRGPSRTLPDVRVRLGADGFYLSAPGVSTGSVIRWRCMVGNTPQSGSIAYEPGPEGLFIYTGGKPTDVTILEVLPSDHDPGTYRETDVGPTHFSSGRSTGTHRSSQTSTSHRPPPAY
ncbi:MAG: formylglycine-generating enzyme family protein [Planctomycetia bacterium]|nr:formylglycine-generating enzyme family protein [Planctomycetia bacterium]